MKHLVRIVFMAALLATALAAGLSSTGRASRPLRHTSPVVTDPKPDFVEAAIGDVFVVNGFVLQNPDDSTPDDTPLYSIIGESLDLTWGEWKRPVVDASKAVQLDVAGHAQTTVSIRVHGLVPNGVYSLFAYGLGPDTVNPLCSVEPALPVHSLKPGQRPDSSSFYADSSGRAVFSGRVDRPLLDSSDVVFELIYHPDGTTYGDLPNRGESDTQGAGCSSSFGYDTFRQTLILQRWT
jgi:hypothetical protein